MSSKTRAILIPLISVIIALIISAVIIIILGKNPIEAYLYLFLGAFVGKSSISQTLVQATPLIYTGLAVAFAYQAKLFNIGAQGQIIIGGLTAAAIGAFINSIGINNIVVILVLSAAAGFAWAAIAGILKAKLGVHEVISTIMLNYIALSLEQYLLNNPLKEGGISGPSPQTPPVADWVLYPKLIEGTNLNFGFIVAIVCAIVIWFILNKTVTGFEIKSVGHNPTASENAGINVPWRIILAMGIAGALAGLGGAERILGGVSQDRYLSGIMAEYGFDGIAVALLGKNHPIGIIFAAILFGALRAGAIRMQFMANVPSQVIIIVQAIIIVLVVLENMFGEILDRIFVKKETAE
jgi:ABC-type uncharacterized transport system permease subunit